MAQGPQNLFLVQWLLLLTRKWLRTPSYSFPQPVLTITLSVSFWEYLNTRCLPKCHWKRDVRTTYKYYFPSSTEVQGPGWSKRDVQDTRFKEIFTLRVVQMHSTRSAYRQPRASSFLYLHPGHLSCLLSASEMNQSASYNILKGELFLRKTSPAQLGFTDPHRTPTGILDLILQRQIIASWLGFCLRF